MLHIIYYRILSTIRNKMDIFWALCFPIILGTCFFAAFSDIYKMDFEFESIPIAAVLEENSQLKNVLDTLSNQGMEEDSEPMLKVNYTNMAEAEKMLNEKRLSVLSKKMKEFICPSMKMDLRQPFCKAFRPVCSDYVCHWKRRHR